MSESIVRQGYQQPDHQVQINYTPQGKTLRDFHRVHDQRFSANDSLYNEADPYQYHHRIIIGPLGSGKTQSMIAECLSMIDKQPARREFTRGRDGIKVDMLVRRTRGVICRNTYADLQNTTIKDWREWTDEMDVGEFREGAKGKSPTWKCEYFKRDGTKVIAEVVFLAFDVIADMRKARGIQCTWVWCNEIKEMERSIVNMLFGRTGRYPARGRQILIGDSNAPDRDHWLGRIALRQAPDKWWIGIQPGGVIRVGGRWEPNPEAENIQNLPAGYYENQVAGNTEAWIRSNLANEFVFLDDGRPVHPGFNEKIHVARLNPTPGIPLVVGIDFGRTPAASVWQPQENGQWYCLLEVVTQNTSALRFGRILRRVLNEKYENYLLSFWGDPAGDQQAQTRDETPFEMLAIPHPDGGGIEAFPTHTNDFEERITSLDNLLESLVDGQPAVLIDEDCTTMIKGLAGGYKYKRVQVSGSDRYHDKPEKGPESHVVESGHYALLGAGAGISMFSMDGDMDDLPSHPDKSRFE